jgi:modification methylase
MPTPTQQPALLSAQPLAGTSVWAVTQRALPTQRRGRYLPASGRHPARMAPDLAAHLIRAYTRPGDLVVDPMCGTGTTLVEAVHAGRAALGMDCEERWVNLAEQNLALAAQQGATGPADVVHADARDLPGCLPAALSAATAGTAALILTSPPYGPRAHTRVRSTRETGRAGMSRRGDTYTHHRADQRNLANAGTPQMLMAGFSRILRGARHLLRPDGLLVVTARPWRRYRHLIDLPSLVLDAAEDAGYQPTDRCVALLAGMHHGHLQPRPSFLQLIHLRADWAAGTRPHLIVHEDILVFRAAPSSTSGDRA